MPSINITRKPRSFFTTLLKLSYLLLALFILLFAVLVTAARLATPYVSKDRIEIQAYLGEEIGKPVHIGKIEMWWSGFGPSVKLENLTIDRRINIQSLDLDLNLVESLYYRKLVINNIVIMGGAYNILQLPNHGWAVNGVKFVEASGRKTSFLTDLFSFSDIAVKNVHAYYTNLQHKVINVDIAYVHLNNNGGEHNLSGMLNLLRPYKVPFRFHLKIGGDVSDFTKIQAKLYLKSSDLLLSQVLPQKVLYGQQIQSGFGDVQFWIDWRDLRIQQVQSQVSVTDLQLLHQDKTVIVPHFSANLAWSREKAGWLFSADHVFLNLNHSDWPENSLYFEQYANGFRFGMDYLSIADLRALLGDFPLLSHQQLQWLSAFNPQGELSHLVLQHDGDDWSLSHLKFGGRFAQISLSQQQVIPAIPAVKNFSGQLYWQQNHGAVFVNSKNLSIGDDHLFAQPMVLQQAYLDLGLQQSTSNVFSLGVNNFYVANSDIQGFMQGLLRLDLTGKNSQLSLVSSLHVNRLQTFHSYLPVVLMKPKMKAWFEQAFQSGDLTATTLFHGNLRDFPFQDNHKGSFYSDMIIHQLTLNYNHHWPLITSDAVTLAIVNDTLTVNSAQAASRHIMAKNVSVIIPAMTQPDPRLTLKLTGSNTLENMLDFIDQSDLADSLGKNIGLFHATGTGVLNLQLNIPLDHADDTAVVGQLKIQDGALRAFDIPNSIRKIKGELDFTEHGLTISHATALSFNHPAIIHAETLHTNAGLDILNLYSQGSIDAVYLQSVSHLPITNFATGLIPFDVCIIRILNAKHDSGAITFQAKSSLSGVAVNLPDGLAKKAAELRPFQLQFKYVNQRFSNIKVAYSDLLDFDLDTITNKTNNEGFSVAVTLKELNWSQWQSYFAKLNSQPAVVSQSNNSSLNNLSQQYHNKIVNIDLKVNQVKFYKQMLNNVAIVLQPQNNAWDFRISSDSVTGDIIWPLGRHAIIGTFSQLHLQPVTLSIGSIKQTLTTPAKVNLKKIPAVQISIKNFSYGTELQGKLLLDLSRLPSGLSINNLEFISKLFNIKVSGKWLQRRQTETTALAGAASSDNFSLFLKTLAIDGSDGFNLSTIQSHFNLNWTGTPYHPVLKTIAGDINLTLGPGNITDIGKNAESKLTFGRLLNALSVQAILQKLTMNAHEYQQGYNFNSMQGQFTLKQGGDLHTQQAKFDGPVASVGFSGNIGLLRHNFDLNLEITPHVTGSVPVVAGLLINPAVGLAAWFANFLFSPVVGQAAAQHFQMTGPWSDPKIVSLNNNTTNSPQSNKVK